MNILYWRNQANKTRHTHSQTFSFFVLLILKCFAVIFPSNIKIQYMFARMIGIGGKADPEQVACVLEDDSEMQRDYNFS